MAPQSVGILAGVKKMRNCLEPNPTLARHHWSRYGAQYGLSVRIVRTSSAVATTIWTRHWLALSTS
jgi:hypothetical protein